MGGSYAGSAWRGVALWGLLLAGVIGCEGTTPRADLPTVGELENEAYVRYSSVWSQHTFDSPRVVAQVALVAPEGSQRARFAGGASESGVAGGGSQAGVAGGGSEAGTAGGDSRAEARAGATQAGDAAASTRADAAGARSADAAARGQVSADEAAGRTASAEQGARSADHAAAGHTSAAAQGARTAEGAARGEQSAEEHLGHAEDSAHRGESAGTSVAGRSDAQAAGGRADVTAQRPHLALRKMPEPTHALPGDRVRFTFHVHNPGPLVVEDVVIIDELPAELAVIAVTGAEMVVDGDERHLRLEGTIPVLGNRTVTLETRVADDLLPVYDGEE